MHQAEFLNRDLSCMCVCAWIHILYQKAHRTILWGMGMGGSRKKSYFSLNIIGAVWIVYFVQVFIQLKIFNGVNGIYRVDSRIKWVNAYKVLTTMPSTELVLNFIHEAGGSFHWSQFFTPSTVYAHPLQGLRTCSGQGGVVRHTLLHSCLLQKMMPQVVAGPKWMRDLQSRPAPSPWFGTKLNWAQPRSIKTQSACRENSLL